MQLPYQDRYHAGRVLAKLLKDKNLSAAKSIVLALPRGGVPVAYEIARALNLPLDVFIVRKLGVPYFEELAMGAIASGGMKYLNEKIIQEFKIKQDELNKIEAKELTELKRRERQYRGKHSSANLKNKTVILVDDGMATGASMHVAILALQKLFVTNILIAVPVASLSSCEMIIPLVKEIICPYQIKELEAVGAWYENFSPTEDEEVTNLLAKSHNKK